MNPSDLTPEAPRSFASAWDRYVQERVPTQRWPGDDWGDRELWNRWFTHLFEPAEVQTWQRAVEIGQGTGKYTRRVLDAGCERVLACDVSARFLELCRERHGDLVDAGRLLLQQIDEREPDAVFAQCEQLDWCGRVDGYFSIDTMVHLPFTTVASHLLQATRVLRLGGFVVLTFADGTTDNGFRKLIGDMNLTLRWAGDAASGCFHWISPQLLTVTAERIGYEVIVCRADPEHHRDGHFVARFAHAERAAQARALL